MSDMGPLPDNERIADIAILQFRSTYNVMGR